MVYVYSKNESINLDKEKKRVNEPVLFEILFQLFRFSVSNLNWAYCRIICLLQFDRPISDVFAWATLDVVTEHSTVVPSISFHALRKSSGSENATNPYLA